MTVHLFGAVAVPVLLREKTKDTVKTVNKNFYVDDCLKGSH